MYVRFSIPLSNWSKESCVTDLIVGQPRSRLDGDGEEDAKNCIEERGRQEVTHSLRYNRPVQIGV